MEKNWWVKARQSPLFEPARADRQRQRRRHFERSPRSIAQSLKIIMFIFQIINRCSRYHSYSCFGWSTRQQIRSSSLHYRIKSEFSIHGRQLLHLKLQRRSINPYTVIRRDHYKPYHSSSSALFMTSSRSNKSQWTIGDIVQVQSQKGIVKDVRRGGWYTIQLTDTQEIVKCRKSEILSFHQENADIASKSSTAVDINSNSYEMTQQDSTSPIGVTLQADPGNPPQVPLPSPTIHNLDAMLLQQQEDPSSNIQNQELLKQVSYHSKFENWVVFTDLHCSPSTLDTSLEVLDIVHQMALDNNAGVLFLGDFWHHRGTLRVDCLNAVLKSLETWTVPMIMIPGNHDQVTLGGHDHGLTPLGNAYRVGQDGEVAGPLIFSYPTVFRNALFVPHIRDIATMESVLQSNHAKEACALFVHAEVKGALMNDLMISTHGIPPSSFPSHKHIYSGHFHKPHSVQSSFRLQTPHQVEISNESSKQQEEVAVSIEYLGSPYQISLSEAQQEKQLALLDEKWQCMKRMPLDVGRRNFKATSWDELLQFQLERGAKNKNQGAHKSVFVRKGDRIVLSLSQAEQRKLNDSLDDISCKSNIQILRDAGIMVEIREVSPDRPFQTVLTNNVDGPMPEDMLPESTWKAYLKDAEMRDFIGVEEHDSLLETGLKILEDLDVSNGAKAFQNNQYDLKLSRVSLHGFGPFRESVTYPLYNRGLVLLRGSNGDNGPDSNGSGKSSLAMATLWALTGTLDARRAMDLKVADVVNDDSKTARVTVEGSVNDAPFVVSRTKTALKGDLVFQLDGVDLTTQSVKETQLILEEKLGVDPSIMSRSIFYGQHDMNDLLESTDAKLKEELSLIVSLGLWQEASSIARSKSRDSKKKMDELDGMITLRTKDLEQFTKSLQQARRSKDLKERKFDEALQKVEKIESELTHVVLEETSIVNSNDVQSQYEDVIIEIKNISSLYESKIKDKNSELDPLEAEVAEANAKFEMLRQENTAGEFSVMKCNMSLNSAKEVIEKLEQIWSLDLTFGLPDVLRLPDQCPTCLQPIESASPAHDHLNIEHRVKLEVETALRDLELAEAAYNDALQKASEYSKQLQLMEANVAKIQSAISDLSLKWDTQLAPLQEQLQKKRDLQNKLTERLSILLKKSQLMAQIDAARASFNIEKISLDNAIAVYEGLEDDVSKANALIEDFNTERIENDKMRRLYSDLAERYGQRGVQAFVLQNVVDILEQLAQKYLDHLSDGGQRLELSVDAGERIARNAFVRGSDGEFKQRPLSTLSGGQWRRCSLALSFAFAELVARRGKMKSSLLVLDEPLTHLDRSGRTKFGEVVRRMILNPVQSSQSLSGLHFSTILLILQDLAAEELEEAFDHMDTVVRDNGGSYVRLDKGAPSMV